MEMKNEEKALGTQEKILNSCFHLYMDQTYGLVDIAKQFSYDVTPPSKQLNILLLGNHSAGKSSFINWYVGENIQKTGVAVETQGFTVVKHGRRRETLLAEGALLVLPHFQGLNNIKGLMDFVTMELSPSQARNFKLVNFIDSPGLVDGGLEYPFDVDDALLFLGQLADLVFVYFDPIGQALCRRTLNIVHQLAATRKDGILFFLSKVDEAGSQSDRQKVMVQIVQELCSNGGFNRQGFEIKSIHIPEMASKKTSNSLNQIEEVCLEIDKAVGYTIQRTLTRLGHDCNALEQHISMALTTHQCHLTYTACSFLVVAAGASAAVLKELHDSTIENSVDTVGKPVFWLKIFLMIISFILFSHAFNLKGLFHWKNRFRLTRMKRAVKIAARQKDSMYSEYLSLSTL